MTNEFIKNPIHECLYYHFCEVDINGCYTGAYSFFNGETVDYFAYDFCGNIDEAGIAWLQPGIFND